MEEKISFWGALDVTARTLEDLTEPFQALYDKGDYRMRPGDIHRMLVYLKRIHQSEVKIKKTLSLFKKITS